MTYHWIFDGAPGIPLDTDHLTELGADDYFGTQAEAEKWLGDSFLDLLDCGVEQVQLLDGDDIVYKMALDE